MNKMSAHDMAPVSAGRELVILVHGLTGAPDEMRFVAKKLKDRGYDVITPLLAGHGQGYPEVLATGWRDWLATLVQAYDAQVSQYRRIHVAGICVGGLLGFLLAQTRTIASCTIYAPLFAFDGWAMKGYYRLLPLVWPLMYLPGLRGRLVPEAHPFGLKDQRLRGLVAQSQDSLIAGALDAMPYKCLAETYRLGQVVLRVAPRNRTPLTLIHAREDDICALGNAERLMKRAGGEARLVVLEDSYHMIHVDQERSKVVAATLDAIGYSEAAAVHA